MSIQTKTMVVKSDTSIAETATTIRDTVTFDVSKMPNGITYKGLKAVLSFADPIQWNKASTYDALTVVWDDASHASYASKRRVPQNIELTNEFYWLRTADLDAQVEMYRQEVQEMDGRVTANTNAIAAETARAKGEEQTLQTNFLSTFVTPEMFGAKGDGVTDDTAAINEAVKHNCVFGNKTYLVSAVNAHEDFYTAIDLNDKQYVFNNTVIKLKPNEYDFYAILESRDNNGVDISGGLTIVGDKAAHLSTTGESGHGLHIHSSSNVRVSGVKVTDTWGDGITINGLSDNVRIEGCSTYNTSRNGISIIQTGDVTCRDCVFEKSDRTAPKASVDVEPNENETAGNISFFNCQFIGSPTGFLIAGNGTAKSITLDNCIGDAFCQFTDLGGSLTVDNFKWSEQKNLSYQEVVFSGSMIIRDLEVVKCSDSRNPLSIHDAANIIINGVKFPNTYRNKGFNFSDSYTYGNVSVKNVFIDYYELGKNDKGVHVTPMKTIGVMDVSNFVPESGNTTILLSPIVQRFVKNSDSAQRYYIPLNVCNNFVFENKSNVATTWVTTVNDGINLWLNDVKQSNPSSVTVPGNTVAWFDVDTHNKQVFIKTVNLDA